MSETVRYNIILNDEVSARLAHIEANFQSLENSINDSNRSLGRMGSTMKTGVFLSAANMAFQAGQAIWGMAEAHVKAAGAIQANQSALKVASGSTYEYTENTTFLDKAVKDFSLPIEAATEGLKMWTAATMNSSLRGDTARKVFEDISVSTASMGIDAEATKGIFLALSQMMSKGTVQAEELRGQLGERMPGAFTLMAKSMGVTEQRLNDLMKDGKVIASEVLPKFAATLRNDFGGGLKDSANNINTVMTRLDNMRVRGIEAMTPAIAALLLKLEQLANWVGSLDFEPFIDSANSFYQSIQPLIDVLGRLFGSFEGNSFIMKVLATLFHNLISPLQIVIMGFTNLLLVFESIVEVIKALVNGDFSSIDDILIKQAGRIKDNYLNTFKSIKDGYVDIWTEDPNKAKGLAIDEATKGIDFSFMDNKKLSQSASQIKAEGKQKSLKDANSNISGSAPRNVTINIGSLIGQNTNQISKESEKSTIDDFSKKLLQALQQEIVNVNLQYL